MLREIYTVFKHLLLVTLGIPCTYVSAMDNPFKSDYHHPYTRIIGEDNKNDFLYPGYSEMSEHYENFGKEELYNLAIKYYASPTKENNFKTVRLILKKAEEKDHPQAAESLAYMWERGEGGTVNIDEAIRLYSKAGRLGVENAFMRLADIYQRKNEIYLAYKIYTPLAIQGNLAAQVNVANIIFLGKTTGKINVTSEEMNQILNWCKTAAEKGFAPAQTALGSIFLKGISQENIKIDPNIDEALKWYTKAVNQGDIYAEYRLGYVYFGIKSFSQAARLFKKVIGNQQAEQVLGKKRLGYAAHSLAYIYHDGYKEGKYLAEDVKTAYQKAIGLGNEQAKRNLKAFNIELAQKKGIFSEIRARLTESSSSKPSKQ